MMVYRSNIHIIIIISYICFPWNSFELCSMSELKVGHCCNVNRLSREIPFHPAAIICVCRLCLVSVMDAGRLEQQVASVDRGIAFLKQEHLAMLTGLQLEITHLKRRCHGQSTGDLLLSIS